MTSNPYTQQPGTQPTTPPDTSQEPPAVPVAKRGIGTATVVALMIGSGVLGGGVVAGALTLGSHTPEEPTTNVANSLTQPPADAPAVPEGSVAEVAQKVLPAVVSIQVVTQNGGAEGSGSIISPDGFVLTNHHVVAEGESGAKLQVRFNDGATAPATYVASDPATDIGVIKIDGANNLPTIGFGDSDQLIVGQEVVAVGAPLGLSGTVTSGIVSALERPVRASQGGGESSLIDGIQTDAAINPGNSGGPLVDMNGNLVGMNSVIASLTSRAGGQAGSIGLGFAIPANFAQRVATQLIEDGEAVQPRIGAAVDARSLTDGGLIVDVEPGGPAEAAGLRSGDLITKLNDRHIESSDALIAAIRSHDFGETVVLDVTDPDTGETRQVEVTLTTE
ncbi:S1C family serine protease [Corynebacterium uterequi]|uniref:Trypsin-like serine protease with C-terminal PDZ domain n=1 Tax=Corynebacterium uterequi TaxID=1072256 RepID=A0A0G3HFJ5_9CORY|nr:trypsin-like peptidase domain-containing protein [Corynebacterium uterequi]AKK10698.1 trypsin-like serine protease with C-terminal PDZ domain [Corynebacterium uterequi]